MRLQIALSAAEGRGVYKILCYRRSELTNIPHEGISEAYLKTQEPRWERTVSVLNSEINAFLDQYHMPKNDAFLYWTIYTGKVLTRPSKLAPDWKN